MADRDTENREELAAGEGDANTFASVGGMIGTRNLLIIIITMPLVFLAAVAMIITIFGSPLEDNKGATRAGETVRSTAVESEEAASAQGRRTVLVTPASTGVASAGIALPENMAAGAISLDGDRLAVRIDGEDGASVVIYDLVQGAVVQTIPIVEITDVAETAQQIRTTAVAAQEPAETATQIAETAPLEKPQADKIENITATDSDESVTPQSAALTDQPGVTLAAPGAAPEEPIILFRVSDLEDGELVDDPRPLSEVPVPTPSIGARRTRFVTSPE